MQWLRFVAGVVDDAFHNETKCCQVRSGNASVPRRGSFHSRKLGSFAVARLYDPFTDPDATSQVFKAGHALLTNLRCKPRRSGEERKPGIASLVTRSVCL